MSKIIPRRFQQATESATANYNYLDISAGVGYQVLYLGSTGFNSNFVSDSNFIISPNVFYSDLVSSGQNYTAQNVDVYTQSLNLTFNSSPYNLPRIIKGDAYVTIPVMHRNVDAALYSVYPEVNISLSGSSITSLGSLSGAIWKNPIAAAANVFSEVFVLKIPIAKVGVKVGDVLKVNVKLWGACDAGGPRASNEVYMGFDPQGRLSGARAIRSFPTGSVTTATLQIPYRIDL